MPDRTGPTGTRRRQGRGQAALNTVMRAALGIPVLHRVVSNRVLIIEVSGRKTGRLYRIPVGYVSTADGLLVGTAGTWRRNLVNSQPVSVVVGRKRVTMAAEVITDEERCTTLYRAILARNPVHGRYARIRHDTDGTPNRADLRKALARGVAIARFLPIPAAEASTASD